jgi:flagellar assembly factor FliW
MTVQQMFTLHWKQQILAFLKMQKLALRNSYEYRERIHILRCSNAYERSMVVIE